MIERRHSTTSAVRPLAALLVAAAMLVTAAPAPAAPPFPKSIDLPDGWLPEGIAEGPGNVVYSGSRATGDIVAVDVRTGDLELVVDAPAGRTAIGIEQDRFGRFFVAGGGTGDVFVYSADGTPLRTYEFASPPTFVNDVVVTKDAAWFTDSQRALLYQVSLESDGTLGAGDVVPLGGEYQHADGFNLNGIDATPDGKTLIAVQSNTGALYNIDPDTGHATLIDLGGAALTNGDGILLEGRTLYVVQNRDNQVAVVELDRTLTSGTVVDVITSDDFDVPTTVARRGSTLYLVNARFNTPGTPTTPYWITAVPRL